MVLVDTSVWIGLYRKRHHHRMGGMVRALVARNRAAICGQIWVEFIGGFKKSSERKEFADSFGTLAWLEENKTVFLIAAELLARHPFLGSGDAVIAATAIAHQSPLLTLDDDFKRLTASGVTLLDIE